MFALFLALCCVLANAFFVAAEFSFAKVRSSALMASAKHDLRAKRALHILNHFDVYLSATQLGITIASLGLGWVGEGALGSLLSPLLRPLFVGLEALGWFQIPPTALHNTSVALGFVFISFLHIVVGELVPKSLAVKRAEKIAMGSSLPLTGFYYMVYPALWILNLASKLTLKILGLPSVDHAEGKLSNEELKLVIQGSLDEDDQQTRGKRELLERVLRASDRPVRAVMVSRIEMECLDVANTPQEALKKAQQLGFSRFPLTENQNLDQVTGYMYTKDLIFKKPAKLLDIKRDILFVPEATSVGEVLVQFREGKVPIAIVLDEYGGCKGLVTLEDVVAEIVGDLRDEFQGHSPRFTPDADGGYFVDGSLPVGELELEGIVLPNDVSADTLGGLVQQVLGRMAKRGDAILLGDWKLLVKDVRDRRVHRVHLTVDKKD